MRNPLNKAIAATDNKTREKAPRKDTMNKEFQKIIADANSISSNVPQLREEYVKGIEAAIDNQAKAREAKEEALTGVDFDNACDRERYAHEKEIFFKRKLEDLDFTPRMDEKEYSAHVKTVQVVMDQAADEYRKKAASLMSELVATHREYVKTMDDADQALETLDRAANILQSKYRYKELTFQGAPSKYVQDGNEWRRHAVRYGSGAGYGMITKDGPGYDPYLCNAWHVASLLMKEEDRLAGGKA